MCNKTSDKRVMKCPYSEVKINEDVLREYTLTCKHPNYRSSTLYEGLKRFGKDFVPNYECQFVRELNYEDCPLYIQSKNCLANK